MADLAQASLAGTAIGSTPGSTLPAAGIEARFAVDYAGFRLDVDLRLPGRGVTALFGHSGSGKTTLLRCVAGLEPAARGRLVVNGECWQDDARGIQVPTHRRALGYVFQEASLFPHLSVRRNLEFGLRRIPAAARRVQLEHAVALLGLAQQVVEQRGFARTEKAGEDGDRNLPVGVLVLGDGAGAVQA